MADPRFNKDNPIRQWDYKSFGNMGTSLNPAQANQLQQLNQMISAGPGGTEITTLQRNVWETIPKEHFEDMRRLGILTGVEPTIHSPLFEPAGVEQGQGGGITVSEDLRKTEIRRINDMLDKAITLMDPRHPRNVSVNIHPTATFPGTIYRIADETLKADGEVFKEEGKEYVETDFAIDPATGQVAPLKFEVKYYPPQKSGEKEHMKVWTPAERLENMNVTNWENEVASTFGATEFQEKQMRATLQQIGEHGFTPQLKTLLAKIERDTSSKMHELYDDVRRHSVFEKDNWYKLGTEEQKDLTKYKDEYDKLKKAALDKSDETLRAREDVAKKLQAATLEEERVPLAHMMKQLQHQELSNWADFFNGLVQKTNAEGERVFAPRKFVPLQEFATEKASDTFAQAAVHSFETAQKKARELAEKQKIIVDPLNIAPMVNLENMPANQMAFGRAGQMIKLIEDTRQKTIGYLEKKGYGHDEAKRIAERIVGATWDVGHINLLRPSGFGKNEILDEARKIAPFVRHFHVTDNFGTTDAHLAPGQGNAIPLEQIEEIKKTAKIPLGTKEIIEIGGFVEHHRVSPWPDTLAYFNSPIYETEAGPAWSENSGDIGSTYFFASSRYVAGFGNILPEPHFGMYGAGFSGLPTALGAPMPGQDRSRFSGTPMS